MAYGSMYNRQRSSSLPEPLPAPEQPQAYNQPQQANTFNQNTSGGGYQSMPAPTQSGPTPTTVGRNPGGPRPSSNTGATYGASNSGNNNPFGGGSVAVGGTTVNQQTTGDVGPNNPVGNNDPSNYTPSTYSQKPPPGAGGAGQPNGASDLTQVQELWSEAMAKHEQGLADELGGIDADESRNSRRASEMNAMMGGSVGGNYQGGQIQAQLSGTVARQQARAQHNLRGLEMRMAQLDQLYQSAEKRADRQSMERIQEEINKTQMAIETSRGQTQLEVAGMEFGTPEEQQELIAQDSPWMDTNYDPFGTSVEEDAATEGRDGWAQGLDSGAAQVKANITHDVQRFIDANHIKPSDKDKVIRAAGYYWKQHGSIPNLETVLSMMGYEGF
jgi:hypothetical protein